LPAYVTEKRLQQALERRPGCRALGEHSSHCTEDHASRARSRAPRDGLSTCGSGWSTRPGSSICQTRAGWNEVTQLERARRRTPGRRIHSRRRSGRC
jgi:hypothetical protein